MTIIFKNIFYIKQSLYFPKNQIDYNSNTQTKKYIRRDVTGWMIAVVSSYQVDYYLSNAIPHEVDWNLYICRGHAEAYVLKRGPKEQEPNLT